MLDIKLIRKNPELIAQKLKRRGFNFDYIAFMEKDNLYRTKLLEQEQYQAKKNRLQKERNKDIFAMEDMRDNLYELEREVRKLKHELNIDISYVPNLPHDSVHDGLKPQEQKIVFDKNILNFKHKTYLELNEQLKFFDFEKGTKLTGSRFTVYNEIGARLERALINFMLDTQSNNGYKEVQVPIIVNRQSMFTTGQLPKFEEDMFKIQDSEYFLIPTAEVPLTNLHREETLNEKDLTLKYMAYTPCFRKEAGAYGKDFKGIVRQHQFNKVELVKFCKQEDSYNELENLVLDAESILIKLGLSYRIILLGSEDMGFGAAKCYDIEVYHSGSDKWWECSSCSNFEDFQARRGNIFYKDKDGQRKLVHTLNGSGLATSRLLPAILEYYQQEDGSIKIPEALIPYMNGIKDIK